MTNMNIISFHSEPPISPFAPQWNYIMAETLIPNIDFDHIAKLILHEEQKIISSFPPDGGDGYTNLGPNSLTSRHVHYNVFNTKDPELLKLLDTVKLAHNAFIDYLNIEPRKLWINCWANVMRSGEFIRQHVHIYDKYCYLGGHITIQCENTETVYVNPLDQYGHTETYRSKNEVGKLTLFQDHIPHFTTRHFGDAERITLAFDILVDEYPNKRGSTILFQDPFRTQTEQG